MNLAFLENESSFKSFYPTPTELILNMLDKVDWRGVENVLEPSAGKGDLALEVKACSKFERYYREQIDCIEIDNNLRHILKGNGLKVVHDDFLTFGGSKIYDLIIMNPPFLDGDKHLLKALEMQERWGGQIICVLNADTIKKPYSFQRKILVERLKKHNAKIEFKENCFIGAERSTSVEIALISVNIPKSIEKSYIFENMKKAYDKKFNFDENNKKELTFFNSVDRLLRDFDIEVRATIEFIRTYEALISCDKDSKKPIIELKLFSDYDYKLFDLDVNRYLRFVRRKYWQKLLNKKEITGMLTSTLREKYFAMVQDLADYDFTIFNVREIMFAMNSEMITGVQDAIIRLFDTMTNKYAWIKESENNKLYYNGWKSNKAHMINQKRVVLPIREAFACRYDGTAFHSYRAYEAIFDLEKTLDYLNCEGTGTIVDLQNVLDAAAKGGQTRNIQCKYFKVSLFMKGTMHIKFNPEYFFLVDKLNIYAAQNKGWLPPSYGKKQYKDMDLEEKAVVDSFQGEKNYQKVMDNKALYLYQTANIMVV